MNKYDPSDTTMVVNAFIREINNRIDSFGALVEQRLQTYSALNPSRIFTFAPAPLTSPSSIILDPAMFQDFTDWLEEKVREQTLSVDATGKRWSDVYIESAYRRGYNTAQVQLSSGEDTIGSLSGSYLHGVQLARLEFAYIQTYNELVGAFGRLAIDVARTVALGIAEGKNPRQLTLDISKTLAISKARAETIARTEVIRAHHKAMVQTFREGGVEGVYVKAEWLTAGDERVCPQCKEKEGKVYTLDEVENMIPLHPRCRCVIFAVVQNPIYK